MAFRRRWNSPFRRCRSGISWCSGTPVAAGTASVAVTAVNDGGSATGTLDLVVLASAPVFTQQPVGSVRLDWGGLAQLSALASGVPEPAYQWKRNGVVLSGGSGSVLALPRPRVSAQLARTVARRLRLNEDLAEAIALAHDIGHPPFGHAGEAALNACLKPFGGFDHNLFGLRRVDELEERYPQFPGLNLSFEVREAFVQHCGRLDAPGCAEFRSAGAPLLEAQIADVVDSVAYDTHDTDDALGLGLITVDELRRVHDRLEAMREPRGLVEAYHDLVQAIAELP